MGRWRRKREARASRPPSPPPPSLFHFLPQTPLLLADLENFELADAGLGGCEGRHTAFGDRAPGGRRPRRPAPPSKIISSQSKGPGFGGRWDGDQQLTSHGGNSATLALRLMVLLGLLHLFEAQDTPPVELNVPVLPAMLIHGVPIGNGNLSRLSWREKREPKCQSDEYKHTSGDLQFCCKRCVRGYYKVADCKGEGHVTQCKQCDHGSYTEVENVAITCMLCETCREALGQVEISPCTRTSNVICGCPEGMFKVKTGNDDFYCKNCTKCTNGKPRRDCEGFEDTICHCNAGFFHDEDVPCRPCNECMSDSCRPHCPVPLVSPPASDGSPLFLIATVGVLAVLLVLMGVWIVWKFHCKDRMSSYDAVVSQTVDVGKSSEEAVRRDSTKKQLHLPGHPLKHREAYEVPVCPLNSTALSTAPSLPDCVNEARRAQLPEDPRFLYTVVNTVPPNRWKEFVRRLGLRDYDIQRIDLQFRNYHEGQYEMLQMWRQQTRETGSTVEVICKVLREMDLSGCSEAIQVSLHVDVR